MSEADPDDCVRVSTYVEVEPAQAFALFTDEVDAWWRRGARFRFALGRTGVLRFEGGEGGRFVEDFGDELFEVGRILTWQPARHLAFTWRDRSFCPDETTRVDVRFEPAAAGTRVRLEHSGWSALPPGHPARLGLSGPAFRAAIGSRWAELCVAFGRPRAGSGP